MTPTFNGIGLAVADMTTSLAFYRRLGLDFPPGSEQEPHAEAELPGGIRLMFDTHELIQSFEPGHDPAKETGGPSLAFLCAGPAEVDRLHEELRDHSVTEPWDAVWGQRYAVIKDPDGYQIDLFAWLKDPG